MMMMRAQTAPHGQLRLAVPVEVPRRSINSESTAMVPRKMAVAVNLEEVMAAAVVA